MVVCWFRGRWVKNEGVRMKKEDEMNLMIDWKHALVKDFFSGIPINEYEKIWEKNDKRVDIYIYILKDDMIRLYYNI